MTGRRSERVAEAIRAYVTRALVRDLADPLLGGVVVTTIEVSDDLSTAHIKVRLLVGDEIPAQRREVMRRLHRASTRLRRGLAPSLGLRRVPELRFDYDVGLDAMHRVEELLHEIELEPKGEPSAASEDSPTGGGEDRAATSTEDSLGLTDDLAADAPESER